MTMMALTKLSNCAASTSRMITSAKPKMISMPLVVSPSVAASASGMMAVAGRQQRRRDLSTTFMASPSAKPGARPAVIARRGAAARGCSDGGTARSVSVAMVDIGT